jgi:upstream activation factor subunit UAF30
MAKKKRTARKKVAKKKVAKKRVVKKAKPKRRVVKKAKPKKRVVKKAKPKKKAAKKAKPKKAAKKAKPKKAHVKRTPSAAFMKPMTPSPALAMVVGSQPMPRTEITKKLWEYIKRNRLQDAVNRRMINADSNLSRVFGGRSQVSMFEMTKLVNQHLR